VKSLPKGNPKITDESILRKLSQFQRPISLQELAISLTWNPGKVDGSIRRLQKAKKIATVKIARSKGHPHRFVGLPKEIYWKNFLKEHISNQNNIIIDDPMQVASKYLHSTNRDLKQTMEYDNKILELKSIIEEQRVTLEEYQKIDVRLLKVLGEFQPRIDDYANKLGLDNSSDLLRTMLTDELDENLPFFKELIKIIIEIYRETENPVLRDVIVRAQAAVQRG
jgi:hypothetical protein